MKNLSVAETIFKVRASLLPGEEVRLSGNVPALGCNDPERAIQLITTSTDFPWWTTTEAIFLPGAEGCVKYRYCIFTGGKFDRWEASGTLERTLKGSDPEDEFGLERSKYTDRANVTTKGSSHRAKQMEAFGAMNLKDNLIRSGDTVIIVSYFLPVTLTKNADGSWAAAWETEHILSMQLGVKTLRVGSVRYNNAPVPLEEEDAVSAVLADMRCYPVFVSQNLHFQFYDIFCKQHLWPTVHHIADVYGPLSVADVGAKAQQNLWFVYSTVHKLFRDKILEVFYEGYLVWIHGFHLMLLPSFLRRRLSRVKIGFFFHTPFPSSEIWRTMSRREDLLRGILGADQIGFHLYEYARHFLTTVRRLMGYSYEMSPSGTMTISVDGRDVAITCIHVGVDQLQIDDMFTQPKVQEGAVKWKESFPGKVVVAGIDRLERLKGIPLKLMAIDQFMSANASWRGRIVFAIIGISAQERGQDYHQTRADVRALVDALNRKFVNADGSLLVVFEERAEKDTRLAERLAFFAAADILMITATRDGLNRYPMEFTLARNKYAQLAGDRFRDPSLPQFDKGLIIISEFISSARVMRGAMTVNPWRASEVVSALKHALSMDDVEKADRSRRNLEFSLRLTTTSWALQVMSALKGVEKQADTSTQIAVGFGMQFKVMDLKAGFNQLNLKNVCNSYRDAKKRLILLDWGGTLVADNKDDHLKAFAIATGLSRNRFDGEDAYEGSAQQLRESLESICADPRNVVFVVSGKESRLLTESFGSYEGLGLAAEHGSFYKWPSAMKAISSRSTRWCTLMDVGNQAWKAVGRVVMDLYVQRTHGSYVETKGNALIWQFRDADPEFGYLQSKELEEHLTEIMTHYPVDVIRGGGVSDGYIEVRQAGVSKGLFLEHALSTLKSQDEDADFVLCIGDDSSDEPMFTALDAAVRSGAFPALTQPYSVTVGKKPTSAHSYVDDSQAVLELLVSLRKCASRDNRNYSTNDFAGSYNVRSSSSDENLRGSSSPTNIGVLPDFSDPAQPSSPRSDAVKGGAAIQRSTSLLNMQEYMSSISELNIEDDGAIFF